MSTKQHTSEKLDNVYHSLVRVINEMANMNDSIEASSLLSDMWERLDRLSTVTEARLRALICTDSITTPSVGGWELPSWAFDTFHGANDHCHPGVVRSAELLIKAAVARMPLLAYTNSAVDWPRLDVVEIRWDVKGAETLKWVVYPPELAWPGVKVKAYTRKLRNSSLISRYFRIAHRVLDHLEKHVEWT